MKYQKDVVSLLKNMDDIHLVGGLAAEAGEVCGIFQKASYKNTAVDLIHLKEELGDVFFYASAIADKYGLEIADIMESNIEKLKRRHGK